MHSLAPSGSDAPMSLIVGWAEMHSGMTYSKRAEFAWNSRVYWREETGADEN